MRDQFGGAIFEGILMAEPKSRGSAFGTDYAPYIPIYDPLNPANVMHFNQDEDAEDRAPASGKKCCGGTSPSCKGCDTCGPRE